MIVSCVVHLLIFLLWSTHSLFIIAGFHELHHMAVRVRVVYLHFLQYFSYIMAVNLTEEKQPPCWKSINFFLSHTVILSISESNSTFYYLFYSFHIGQLYRKLWGHHRMVVGFTTTCAISAYHHWGCELESRSWQDVLDTTLCDKSFVSNFRQWISSRTPVSATI